MTEEIEMKKTPIMGLNKPDKGAFNWDVPMNENWDKLDKLGSGRLPFMTPLPMEYKLTGDDAIGWALQGSELDGDTYKTAWEKLTEAQARSTTKTLEIYDITYTTRVDEVTGWIFVDKANYDKAKENLKHSLGFVVDYVEGNKRIILPYKECYWKFGSVAGEFIPQSLPDIKGSNTARGSYVNSADGAFYTEGTYNSQPDWDSGVSGILRFAASRYNKIYQDGADVNPMASTVFLYYRVADSASSGAEINLGNLLNEMNTLKARLEALEKGE